MHELAVCQSIIAQVADIARENNAKAVTRIIVHIGPLSGIEPPLLQHAFPIASAGTIAEQAVLETHVLPVRVRCNICNNENEASTNNLLCSTCGSWQTTLLSGDEMLLQSLELETSDFEKHQEETYV